MSIGPSLETLEHCTRKRRKCEPWLGAESLKHCHLQANVPTPTSKFGGRIPQKFGFQNPQIPRRRWRRKSFPFSSPISLAPNPLLTPFFFTTTPPMPALTLKRSLSRAFSTATASGPSILRRNTAANHHPFQLAMNSNEIIPINTRRTLEPGARLAHGAHVRALRGIKPHSSSTFSSLFAFRFVVGSFLIAVFPQFERRAAFCLSSFFTSSSSSAASAEGGGGGEEEGADSASGSQGMGHEHQYGVDYCQNDDGSPRLSSSLNRSEKEKSDEEKKYARLLTLPTVLTLARVAAVPAFVCTFYVNSGWGPTTTTSIFILAAVTDWLDGYLARKMRQGTAFGAFLDPVADKLMVATTLVLLCSRPLEVPFFGDAPWLFSVPSIAIIGREITMSAVREWAASQQDKLSKAVAVNNLGKWKTATQMIALTILLACRDGSFGRPDALVLSSGVVLLYISAWLAVWSLIVYMRKIWKVLLK